MSSTLTISRFMTKVVHTIGHDRTLADAHKMMRDNRIRHLPVLDGGQLVGMVTERDLHLIETLKGVDQSVTVEEAMSQAPWTATPDTSLQEAAEHMALHKLGSAVVMDGTHIAGVFTTVDAMRALAEVLALSPVGPPLKKKPAARRKASGQGAPR